MSFQEDIYLSQLFDQDIPRHSEERERFVRSVAELDFEGGWPAAGRRANGKVLQWENPDDMHAAPIRHAPSLIRATRGNCSWLDALVVLAAEERAKAAEEEREVQRAPMQRARRRDDERGREVG